MSSVGEDFPKEQARVRALAQEYALLGRPGMFVSLQLDQVLERAERAAASGDVIEILRAYAALKECK